MLGNGSEPMIPIHAMQDPLTWVEFGALLITAGYLLKLTLYGDGGQPVNIGKKEVLETRLEPLPLNGYEFRMALLREERRTSILRLTLARFFQVGTSISLPKQSLRRQRAFA